MRLCSLALVILCSGAFLLSGCANLAGRSTATTSEAPIYDPKADGEQLLAEALKTARREQKRVLLNLGANWCSDSHATWELLTQDPEIRQVVREQFVLTMVDVNRQDAAPRNEELVARLGNPIDHGIPVLLILNSEGEVLNRDPAERLDDEAHYTPAQVLEYLRKWSK